MDGWLKFFGDSAEIISVLFLDCSQENCTKRIQIRAQNSGRIDDNSDSLKKRFDVFFNETMPNYVNLEKVTKVIKVNADSDKDTVFQNVTVELDKVFNYKQ